MLLLKIAVLNLRTHPKRTALILVAVALSVAAMQIVGGFFAGMRHSFFERLSAESGHLQIQPAGRSEALDPYDLAYIIENPDPLLAELRQDARVLYADAMFEFGALVIHAERNLVMRGLGIATGTQFFANVRRAIVAGSFLQNDEQIMLSAETAALLEAEIGDGIVLLVQDSSGAPFYIEYRLAGLFNTGVIELDSNTFFISHDAAGDLLYLPGATREIRVTLSDREHADAMSSEYRALAQMHGGQARSWSEIFGSFAIMLEFFDLFVLLTVVLVVVVAAMVITNAVLMNVFERRSEFGTLRAIGIKRRQQVGLIVIEGTAQGVVGTAVGLALAIPLVVYLQHNGIDMGEMADSFGLAREIGTRLEARDVVVASMTGMVTAIVGSIYAAWVTARESIVLQLSRE